MNRLIPSRGANRNILSYAFANHVWSILQAYLAVSILSPPKASMQFKQVNVTLAQRIDSPAFAPVASPVVRDSSDLYQKPVPGVPEFGRFKRFFDNQVIVKGNDRDTCPESFEERLMDRALQRSWR